MSGAFPQRLSADRRPGPLWAFSAIELRLNRFGHSLAQELANRPGRLRSSVRMALISAIGAGLMATAHAYSLFAIVVVWATVSAPAARVRPVMGMAYLLAIAAALAASMPLAGILAEAPWLLLPFVAAAVGGSTYFLSDTQLLDGWRQVQIFFVSTFWFVIFDPEGFGWSVGYNFGCAVIAFGLLVLFDNVLWPDPAENELLRSLETSLKSIRERFISIGGAFLAPSGAAALPNPSTVGAMGTHLSLLARAGREGISARRYAMLLGLVSATERLRMEVQRMLLMARESVPRRIRQLVQPELRAVLDAIDSGLRTITADLAAGFIEERGAYGFAGPANSALEAYNRREAELRAQFVLVAGSDELGNLSAFVNSLQGMARLLIRTPIASSGMASNEPDAEKAPRSRTDPARMRYCLKLAAATAMAFVVGLTTHRSDLTVILWTVMLAALPTFGASLRKMILRFAGTAIGGLMGLAAIIAISPNFDTVLTYMLVCFIALLLCAYLATGGVAISYAGFSAGVTFLFLFVDLSPSNRDYEALWRLWGLFLGLAIVAVFFLLLWPEYAGDSMTPLLRRILRIALDLVPNGRQEATAQRVRDLEMEAGITVTQLFAVADDARLEGRRSGIDPDCLVDAAGTLRRIVLRLAGISSGRILTAAPRLDEATETVREAVLNALGARLEWWLHFLERSRSLSSAGPVGAPARPSSDEITPPLDEFNRRLEAQGFAQISTWTVEQRRAILAELESMRRLQVQVSELDRYLSSVGQPARL